MGFENIRYDKAGRVATITIDRPGQEYVDKIASKSPIGLRLTKRALNVALEVGVAEAEACQYKLVLACFTSEDRREGMNAFLAKREPQFIDQ